MKKEGPFYRALLVREIEKDHFVRELTAMRMAELPKSEILVKVYCSSLNYKDALSATGNRGVTRRYPHIPGIDAVGVVERSPDPSYKPGDKVIVSGFDMGMNHAGGFAEYLTAPAEWLVPLPEGMGFEECMAWGTAGFTAVQSVARLLENGVSPQNGKVLVTGASGGVGSIAVAILAKLGFKVTAVTGKAAKEFLFNLGASEIVTREDFLQPNKKLLLQEKWAGVVDTVGGEYLETAIKESCYGATVTCCGNAVSADLHLTVYPFILRGVTLAGIDSAQCPVDRRRRLWQKMAGEWRLDQLADLATVITLDELDSKIDDILAAKVKGRIVVNML